MFDEAQGTFVAPEPEPLTIVIERNDRTTSPIPAAEMAGLVATAAMITSEPSWLGMLRQYGRKVASVVQQRTRWMS